MPWSPQRMKTSLEQEFYIHTITLYKPPARAKGARSRLRNRSDQGNSRGHSAAEPHGEESTPLESGTATPHRGSFDGATPAAVAKAPQHSRGGFFSGLANSPKGSLGQDQLNLVLGAMRALASSRMSM